MHSTVPGTWRKFYDLTFGTKGPQEKEHSFSVRRFTERKLVNICLCATALLCFLTSIFCIIALRNLAKVFEVYPSLTTFCCPYHQFSPTIMKLFGRRNSEKKTSSSHLDAADLNNVETKHSDEAQASSSTSKPSKKASIVSNAAGAPADYEMVKRRVRVQLAIIERPLMTETEFLVDSRYRSVKLIGSGAYGIVCSAIDTQTKSRVAIKKILNAFHHPKMARHVLREVRLLRHLNHPHIVQLLDIDVPQQYRAWTSVYIVTSLLDMDLKTAMKARIIDSPLKQKKVAYQMLLALEHMHSLGLMHRDVKSRNLLLDKDFNVQLCDLGESRFYSLANRDLIDEETVKLQEEPELSGVITTMIQSAPELSLGAEYDAEVDIWAAGCVIAELVHKNHEYLFDSTSKQSHVQEIINIVGYPGAEINELLPDHGKWYLKLMKKSSSDRNRIAEKLGPDVDPQALDLVTKMLRFSPKKRLSAQRVLQHPWFDEVRNDESFQKESYDFAKTEPHRKSSKSELKNMVWEEVVAFHPEAPSLGVR